MKKGFTLIELLAVIVILAIVALIATPLILNVIEDSKKSAFENSAYGIVEAAELSYAKNMLGSSNEEIVFTYNNGQEESASGKQLNYKGDKPKEGEVKINNEGQVALAIYDGTYCAEKSFSNLKIKVTKMEEEDCILINLPNSNNVCGDSFIDDRDSENIETYKTVKIGGQCWMAENLRYTGNGCLQENWTAAANACRSHNASDGTGSYRNWSEPQVLYQWNAITDVCPDGWDIPTSNEWQTLIQTAEHFQSYEYWDGEEMGNSGFNALPAGSREANEDLERAMVGFGTIWWSSTLNPDDSTKVMAFISQTNFPSIYSVSGPAKDLGASIRCILD